MCEIYYQNGKNKIFHQVKDLLNLYSLPTNLKFSKINKNFLKKKFLNSSFRQKKIGKFPRYISLKKIGYPKISEFKNNQKIKKTIENVLFN